MSDDAMLRGPWELAPIGDPYTEALDWAKVKTVKVKLSDASEKTWTAHLVDGQSVAKVIAELVEKLRRAHDQRDQTRVGGYDW